MKNIAVVLIVLLRLDALQRLLHILVVFIMRIAIRLRLLVRQILLLVLVVQTVASCAR